MAEYPYKTTGSGWTCPSCGAFVPNGVTHSCPTATYTYPQYNYPPFLDNTALNRIADALEKLIELLEKREK